MLDFSYVRAAEMLICTWRLCALPCLLTCLFSLQLSQQEVNWNRGKSATAFEMQSLVPYTANLGMEEIMRFNLQLGFLHNDAFPPQLSHRT